MSGKIVAILGGRGGMGQIFRAEFEKSGDTVLVLGRFNKTEWPSLLQRADLCVVSVPIDVTGDIIQEVGPLLRPDAILTDFTSIKKNPMEAMLAAHKGPVVGLHPMFGPGVQGCRGQKVVICDGRKPECYGWLMERLENWGAETLRSTPEEHDRMMVVVQTLRHFAHFAFGYHLMKEGVEVRRTLDFSSPVYRLEIEMVGRMFGQDGMLYAEIMSSDPERREAIQRMQKSFTEAAQIVTTKSTTEINEVFKKVTAFFGDFCEEALVESSRLINERIGKKN